MGVQAVRPEATIEGFDEGLFCRLARSREVQSDASLISPQIQIVGYELGPLVDLDRRRESYRPANAFQYLDNADRQKVTRGTIAGEAWRHAIACATNKRPGDASVQYCSDAPMLRR